LDPGLLGVIDDIGGGSGGACWTARRSEHGCRGDVTGLSRDLAVAVDCDPVHVEGHLPGQDV
jgi:hypothetical protein